MEKGIIFSGVGGQGALTSGLIFAHTMMKLGKKILYHPEFASQMRGGYSSSFVITSDERITAISRANVDIVVDTCGENYKRDCKEMVQGGTYLVNADMIVEDFEYRKDINVIKKPITTVARENDSEKAISFVAYGMLLKLFPEILDFETAVEKMKEYFTDEKKEKFIPSNEKAMRAGYENA